MRIGKHFEFEASHQLPYHKGKCSRLHGHSYKLTLIAEGNINKEGMVVDFDVLSMVVKETIIEKYDHRHLNDFFENPTAETLAEFFFEMADKRLREATNNSVRIVKLRLYETAKSFAEVDSNA